MKILKLDIETFPHKAFVWGLFKPTITLNHLIASGHTACWSANWLGQKEVMFSSIQEDGEKEMLLKIWKLLDEADAVVHYNGENFDVPTLNKEFLRHSISPPSPFHQIDLYKTIKKRFRLVSNKLDYVATLLNIKGKVKHQGMQLWVDCMNGCPKAWKKMKQYNIQDVKLLDKVYKKILPWIQDHPNHGLYVSKDRPVCTNCGGDHIQKRGTYSTKQVNYTRYQCMDCLTWLRSKQMIDSLERRRKMLVSSQL